MYWDNGKENGNYYIVYWGNTGIMEKKMETIIVCWGNMGIMEKEMEATIVHWGNFGTVEKKMEPTIVCWGNMRSLGSRRTVVRSRIGPHSEPTKAVCLKVDCPLILSGIRKCLISGYELV